MSDVFKKITSSGDWKPFAAEKFFEVLLRKRPDLAQEHLNLGALKGVILGATVPCPAFADHALYATCPLCRGSGVVETA